MSPDDAPASPSKSSHTGAGALPDWFVVALFFIVPLCLTALLVKRHFMPVGGGLDISTYQVGRDFLNVWVGPQLAFSGRVNSAYDFIAYQVALRDLFGQAVPFHIYSYPPHTLLLYWPFAHLPYFWGLTAWTLAGFAALATVTLSQLPRSKWPFALALLACSPAVLFNGLGGQNGCFSGALLVGGLMMMDRRPVLAGILFGLLTFKPHLGLVLAFALLALRAWTTIGAAAVTTAALVGLSVALFGLEPWSQWSTVTSKIQMMFLYDMDGFYVYTMPSWFSPLRTAGVPYSITMGLQALITVAIVVLSWRAVQRTRDAAVRACVIAAATPLALPYAFNYDLPCVAVAIVWMMMGRVPFDKSLRLALLFAWLAPMLSVMNETVHQLAITPAALTWLFAMSLRLPSDAANDVRLPFSLWAAPAMDALVSGARARGWALQSHGNR